MILPLGDESYTRRVPYVNVAIIAINMIVFAAVNVFSHQATTVKIIQSYGLVPGKLVMHQFLTCMFLHGGWMHIIGNMWFLWVFGDAVENRLGHLGYAVFYLAAGIGASAFYLLLTPRTMIPCVGASGAIFGVVGAYAVLFPKNRIKMFYWFWWFWAGTFHIRAMWIIGFYFLEQVGMYFLMKDFGVGGVAYAAHLGGGIVGLAVALGVRSFLPAPQEPDVWEGGIARGAAQPPLGVYGITPTAYDLPDRQPLVSGTPEPVESGGGVDFLDGDIVPLDDVSEAFFQGDPETALELYKEHASCRPGMAMAALTQLNVAHTYFDRAEFDEALDAYRLYIDSYGHEAEGPLAKFRAAVILSRRHDRPEEAGKLLLEVVMEHPDPEITALAREQISRIRAARV